MKSRNLVQVNIVDDVARVVKSSKRLEDEFLTQMRALEAHLQENKERPENAYLENVFQDQDNLYIKRNVNMFLLRLQGEAGIGEDVMQGQKSVVLNTPTWTTPQFGLPLEVLECIEIDGYESPIPSVLVFMECYLLMHDALKSEGIFRLAPDSQTTAIVKEELNDGTFDECGDINCVANNIKVFFRDLPIKLLEELGVRQLETMINPNMEDILLTISEPRRSVFLWLIDLCVNICSNSHVNKMTPNNMGIVFAPNLYDFDQLDPMVGMQASRGMTLLVEAAINFRISTGTAIPRAKIEQLQPSAPVDMSEDMGFSQSMAFDEDNKD